MLFKKYFLFSLLAWSILAGMPSCKTPKTLSSNDLKDRSPEYLMKKLAASQMEADWLSAKLKVSYKSDEFSMGFSGHIRMQKDSAIWINVRKLGFEVARALITKDSVYVIDRFNNEFQAESLDYIRRMMNFPATFDMLQSIVLGNPVFFSKSIQSELNGQGYRLWTEGQSPKGEYLLNGIDFSLKKMCFREEQPNRVFEIELSKYGEAAKRRNFSYFRELKMNSRETGQVTAEIEFSDVEIDVPKTMPFEIPANYKRS